MIRPFPDPGFSFRQRRRLPGGSPRIAGVDARPRVEIAEGIADAATPFASAVATARRVLELSSDCHAVTIGIVNISARPMVLTT